MAREWLSLKEGAALLRIHPETLRKLVKAGKLPAFQVGKSWRLDMDEVMAAGKRAAKGE